LLFGTLETVANRARLVQLTGQGRVRRTQTARHLIQSPRKFLFGRGRDGALVVAQLPGAAAHAIGDLLALKRSRGILERLCVWYGRVARHLVGGFRQIVHA
jgi:hypothetical protein